MTGLGNLIRRNIRLFFKDKGMFFSSLITPIILLVLYVTFLAKVYRDSFASAIPFNIGSRLLYLIGSLDADNQLFRSRRRTGLCLHSGLVYDAR